jgi:hypothetical protein
MKSIRLSAVAILAGCIVAYAAQTPGSAGGPPPPGFGTHGPGPIGMEMRTGKVVTDAPYSADVKTSVIQTLADGNTINRVTTGHVARDRQGRTYFQQTITGVPWAQNGRTTVTFISDPVSEYTYVLNPSTKVAMRRAFKFHTGESGRFRSPNGERPDAKGRVETDLGQQTINGLTAAGKSITRTIAAGEIGNAQPIVEKSEVWTSSDLQVVILSKRSDPRFGVSTYSLSNIQRNEPSAALFQVPAGYTVQDAPAAGHWRGN